MPKTRAQAPSGATLKAVVARAAAEAAHAHGFALDPAASALD